MYVFVRIKEIAKLNFKPYAKVILFIFAGDFLILMKLGAEHVEHPFIIFGLISTILYFFHYIVVVPLISLIENLFTKISSLVGVLIRFSGGDAYRFFSNTTSYLNPDKPPLRLPPCWSLAPKSHGGLPHLWDPTRKIDLPFRDLDIPPYDDVRDIFKHVGNNRLGRVYRVYWDWDYNLLKYFPSWSVWSRPTPEILENYLGITANSPYDIREDHYYWWVRNFDRKVLKISPYTHNTNFPTTVQDVIRGDVLKYGTNEVLPPTAYELWEAGVYCTWKKDSNGNWVHTTPVETLCDWEKPQPNGKKSRPIYSDPIFYRSKNLGSINSGSGNSGSGNSRSGNSRSGNSGSGNSGSGNSGSGNYGSGNSGSGNYRSGKYKIPKIGEKYPGSWVPVYGPSRGVRGTTPEGAWWSGKSPARLKLSNSGNALKLWLPLNGRICIWINNTFMVTILKMMETEIGNRGSKLIIVCPIHTFVIIVNEQRVDGSWWEKISNTWPKIKGVQCFSHLRCILVGFQRNYRVLSLSKQRHTYIGYSTLATQCRSDHETCKLNPNWVTGFVDGEGCFTVSIYQRKDLKLGWHVKPSFQISLHKRDESVLEDVKISLHVGHIYERGPKVIEYVVRSLKELEAVINHFHKFPLKTRKRADFELILMVHEIMNRKEHLTPEGLRKIVAIRASMNWGLSEKLKSASPDVVPVVRPIVENKKVNDPNWLAGFTSGEGCFWVNVWQNSTSATGYQVKLVFEISQHILDEIIMKSLVEFLKCGIIFKNREVISFRVTKFHDITEKIIPLFRQEKYPIHGVKALDFADFCKVAKLMKDQKHLTKQGLEQIKKIKAVMNTGRKWS